MSLLKLIYQSPDGNASLLFNGEEEVLVIKFRGEVTDKDFKKVNNAVCKEFEENGHTSLIYDLKEVTKISLIARTWFTTKYLPQYLQKHGSKFRAAIVDPINLFERQMVKLIFEVAAKYLSETELKFVADEQEGIDWIRANRQLAFAKLPH